MYNFRDTVQWDLAAAAEEAVFQQEYGPSSYTLLVKKDDPGSGYAGKTEGYDPEETNLIYLFNGTGQGVFTILERSEFSPNPVGWWCYVLDPTPVWSWGTITVGDFVSSSGGTPVAAASSVQLSGNGTKGVYPNALNQAVTWSGGDSVTEVGIVYGLGDVYTSPDVDASGNVTDPAHYAKICVTGTGLLTGQTVDGDFAAVQTSGTKVVIRPYVIDSGVVVKRSGGLATRTPVIMDSQTAYRIDDWYTQDTDSADGGATLNSAGRLRTCRGSGYLDFSAGLGNAWQAGGAPSGAATYQYGSLVIRPGGTAVNLLSPRTTISGDSVPWTLPMVPGTFVYFNVSVPRMCNGFSFGLCDLGQVNSFWYNHMGFQLDFSAPNATAGNAAGLPVQVTVSRGWATSSTLSSNLGKDVGWAAVAEGEPSVPITLDLEVLFRVVSENTLADGFIAEVWIRNSMNSGCQYGSSDWLCLGRQAVTTTRSGDADRCRQDYLMPYFYFPHNGTTTNQYVTLHRVIMGTDDSITPWSSRWRLAIARTDNPQGNREPIATAVCRTKDKYFVFGEMHDESGATKIDGQVIMSTSPVAGVQDTWTITNNFFGRTLGVLGSTGEACQGVCAASNGNTILVVSTWLGTTADSPTPLYDGTATVLQKVSQDGGASWSEPATVASVTFTGDAATKNTKAGSVAHQGNMIRLSSGVWVWSVNNLEANKLSIFTTKDFENWTEDKPSTFVGGEVSFAQVDGNTVVAIGRTSLGFILTWFTSTDGFTGSTPFATHIHPVTGAAGGYLNVSDQLPGRNQTSHMMYHPKTKKLYAFLRGTDATGAGSTGDGTGVLVYRKYTQVFVSGDWGVTWGQWQPARGLVSIASVKTQAFKAIYDGYDLIGSLAQGDVHFLRSKNWFAVDMDKMIGSGSKRIEY